MHLDFKQNMKMIFLDMHIGAPSILAYCLLLVLQSLR